MIDPKYRIGYDWPTYGKSAKRQRFGLGVFSVSLAVDTSRHDRSEALS